jgi:hypothetical protein
MGKRGDDKSTHENAEQQRKGTRACSFEFARPCKWDQEIRKYKELRQSETDLESISSSP